MKFDKETRLELAAMHLLITQLKHQQILTALVNPSLIEDTKKQPAILLEEASKQLDKTISLLIENSNE